MKYYIVQKQQIINDIFEQEIIGYVESLEDKNYIEVNYENNYMEFIENNRSSLEQGTINIKEFFNDIPYSYIVDIELENIENMGLEKININNL